MEEVDLFTCIETLPPEVQAVLEKHQEGWEESYTKCDELLKDLEPLGYTFDYYLDAAPYNLRLKTT